MSPSHLRGYQLAPPYAWCCYSASCDDVAHGTSLRCLYAYLTHRLFEDAIVRKIIATRFRSEGSVRPTGIPKVCRRSGTETKRVNLVAIRLSQYYMNLSIYACFSCFNLSICRIVSGVFAYNSLSSLTCSASSAVNSP